MIPLRDKIPVRRSKPTRNPKKDWKVHKPDLKEDFYSHCAYCFSYDGYRHTYFEADHFIPQVFFLPLGNIKVTDYYNLVYSCKFCNYNKRAKWPSKSETVYNDGKRGFIDPCTDEIETHLYRTSDGGIMWKTELGKWLFSKAFNFDQRQDSIKVLWNLNRLKKVILDLDETSALFSKDSNDYKEIRAKIGEYAIEYFWMHDALIEFYNNC
jgi:hypothetical protein